jgi:glycosyltransferase involved in cell wall biosynthesis
MNICIITDNFLPSIGGIAKFYGHLAKLLVQYGHNVIVLTIDAQLNSDDRISENDGYTVVRLSQSYKKIYHQYKPYFRPGGHDAPHWLAMGFAIRNWLLQHGERYKLDIMEVSDYGGLGAFLIGDNLPPFAITAHSSLHQLQPYSNQPDTDHIKVLKQLESTAFNTANAIIAHSPLNQQSVEDVFKRKAFFARAPWEYSDRASSEVTSGVPIVLAGLQNIKGSVFVAETLSFLAKKNIASKIKWLGYDTYTSPSKFSMSNYLAKKYPDIWQTNFLWTGRQEYQTAMRELATSPFLIIPSLWETFNYTALEAAAFSKPCIITKTTGASYLFTNMQDAVLVDADNIEEMAEAILLLQQDQELRKQLGNNARETIQAYFQPEKIYEERIKIYEQIAASKKWTPTRFEESMSFLNSYLTTSRKQYYSARAWLKRILKPSTSE